VSSFVTFFCFSSFVLHTKLCHAVFDTLLDSGRSVVIVCSFYKPKTLEHLDVWSRRMTPTMQYSDSGGRVAGLGGLDDQATTFHILVLKQDYDACVNTSLLSRIGFGDG
jgi:hypothetical protein